MDCVYNSKVVFLFDFLDDIVTFSHYPDQLDEAALDKIALNLRALSFLVESQFTGAIKYQDIVFNAFAYTVWKKMGAKKISANDFWTYVTKKLNSKENEGEFTTVMHSAHGAKRTDIIGIHLETNKSGSQAIRCICEAKDIPDGRPKSKSQIEKIWKDLQK